jgi:hypothetical protein
MSRPLVPLAPWASATPTASLRPLWAAFQTLLGLVGQHTPTTYRVLYVGESAG